MCLVNGGTTLGPRRGWCFDLERYLEHGADLRLVHIQRQTVVSQFFQLDRLVVEGGKSVSYTSLATLRSCAVYGANMGYFQGKQTGDRNDIIRQTTE